MGSKPVIISHYHASRVTVTLAHTIQLKRQLRGLSIMLEKTLGVTLVTKLHAILLVEGDFNMANKIIYGVQMLNNVCKHNLMAEEIFSEKIEWPMMVYYARHYSMIFLDRHESLQ